MLRSQRLHSRYEEQDDKSAVMATVQSAPGRIDVTDLLRRVPVPAPVERQKTCDEKIAEKGLVQGNRLGKGSFGTVNEMCDQNTKTCPYALKKILFVSGDNRNSFIREVYILRKLQNTAFAPKLKEAYLCKDYGLLLSEKMTGSMWNVLESNGVRNRKGFLPIIDGSDLMKMVALVEAISRLGIIHGDLKPDNFLYEGQGPKDPHKRIVLNDFGLSSDQSTDRQTVIIENTEYVVKDLRPAMGWAVNEDCPDTVPDRPDDISKTEWALQVNLYQFEFSLVRNNVLVYKADQPNKKFLLFEQFDTTYISQEVRDYLDSECDEAKCAKTMYLKETRKLGTTFPQLR